MPSSRLTLICHARTIAQKLARFPTNEPVEDLPVASDTLKARFASPRRLICAPELRTRQTAAGFGVDAQVEPALRDCDWGRWHGQSIKDLQTNEADALQAWLADPEAAPHGGESVRQLTERVSMWLDTIAATPGHVVAVTHPFVIRAALMQVLQGAAFNAIDVEPLAMIELRFNGIWRLRLPGMDLEEGF
ncbi:histidine phosphatase family protein [Pseudomonas moraviensis subsp. stanleyae]|uniref:histidine phosphatase family protein n=1 Tax=Pseudomonas moraviensis TaxID=321662 RepID=UPI002E32A954|nr:histidine phosphatase family protein [Pseudomonas moraviensis]MED7670938.1 histidine phosphatase family protein [Pseudomonas moraviensis subsp. stanleyae]